MEIVATFSNKQREELFRATAAKKNIIESLAPYATLVENLSCQIKLQVKSLTTVLTLNVLLVQHGYFSAKNHPSTK